MEKQNKKKKKIGDAMKTGEERREDKNTKKMRLDETQSNHLIKGVFLVTDNRPLTAF